MDAAVHHGPKGCDARVLPIRRLVPVLQDRAHRLTEPSERPAGARSWARRDQLRSRLGPGRLRRAPRDYLSAPVGRRLGDDQGLRDSEPCPEEALGPNKDDPAVAAEIQKFVSVVRPTAAMVGIAFPGTFILDRQGRVTSRFFEESYIERNTVASILTKVSGVTAPVAATKISTAHLEMTVYGSDATIAAGNRFSLSVRVAPHAGVHVYAPGASGYRIVGLKVEAQSFLKVLTLKYPASEIYHFKPLDERVPVYQKPFTLVQDVVLDGARDSQSAYRGKESITIAGTLEYQACDDKICFNPAAVPVSWTVALRPLDTQRAAPSQ